MKFFEIRKLKLSLKQGIKLIEGREYNKSIDLLDSVFGNASIYDLMHKNNYLFTDLVVITIYLKALLFIGISHFFLNNEDESKHYIKRYISFLNNINIDKIEIINSLLKMKLDPVRKGLLATNFVPLVIEVLTQELIKR